MKTYPVHILRKALLSIIDSNKFVRFTLFNPPRKLTSGKHMGNVVGGRPLKCKGKINQIYATNNGIGVSFKEFYISRSKFAISQTATISLKNIRWKDCPFDLKLWEAKCQELTKKLTEHV